MVQNDNTTAEILEVFFFQEDLFHSHFKKWLQSTTLVSDEGVW